ncbi:hypothetical protein G9A89_008607 [Geosiphon pyriformis]|nr:hypothetical protein G9A89_008607 [Geosiphon pyriformis]
MPKASVTPSSLTTPSENLDAKPESKMGTEPSTGIRPFFSMYAQCLTQTNQMSSLKATQIEHTKLAILMPAILGSQKMETAF